MHTPRVCIFLIATVLTVSNLGLSWWASKLHNFLVNDSETEKNTMHLILILAATLGLGLLYPFVSSKLQGFIPASVTSNTWGQGLVVGAFILTSVMIVLFVLKATVGKRRILPV